MPVISFISAKGGVGKTTTALVLACELAEAGAQVTLIDADPNQPLVAWAEKPGRPQGVSVIGWSNLDREKGIIDIIEAEARRVPFVLVDLAGTGSEISLHALSISNLVLVPSQGSHLDADQAVKAAQLIRRNEKAFRRAIPHAVVLTQIEAAIAPRDLRHVLNELDRLEIPALRTRMMKRQAFRTLFAVGGDLAGLSRELAHNPAGARANAAALAGEVIEILRDAAPAPAREPGADAA